VHLGTGNYNSTNSRLYTDLSYLTTNTKLTKDVETFFNSLENVELPSLTTLLYGNKARTEIIARILREAHEQGHIIVKVNHLTDTDILNALINAADSGAKVEIIARSTLTCLYSKFNVISIVGRFLEHARICAFRGNGEWEVLAGSADWMPRNFDARVELLFPIYDKVIKDRIVNLLRRQLKDDRNGFLLLPDTTQKTQWSGRVDSQLSKL